MFPKYPVTIYLIWRLIILLYQIFLQPFYKISPNSATIYQRIFLSWTTYWDTGHYTGIASSGYHYPQQAFFPLWPVSIKTLSLLGISIDVASFILSFIFGLSVFISFYLLAKELVGLSKAKYALLLFACFPSTMFLHAGYTEGLFLTLTLLSFLMLEKKLYLYSAILAGLTTMTRLAGIGVTAAYLFVNQSLSKKVFLLSLSLSGVLFYMLYLHLVFGNSLLFLEATKEWCQVSSKCRLTFPLMPLLNYGNLLLIGWVKPSLNFMFLDWFFAVVFLLLSFFVLTRLNLSYFVYCLVVILLPLLSGSIVGMLRYILIVFPVFLVLPSVIRSKILFLILCFLLLLLQLRFITFFSSREWVA